MKVGAQKLAALLNQPIGFPGPGESFRNQDVFFLGDRLPLRQTLEMLFASDCDRPVELYHLTFADPSSFAAALPLAQQIQKNFKGYRMGRFLYSPPVEQIDAAYAAGLELIDLPFFADTDRSDTEGQRANLQHARTLFARWAVVTSVYLQEAHRKADHRLIEELLASGVLPLPQLPNAAAAQADAWLSLYQTLVQQWRRSKANLKPMMPLLLLCTPLLPEPPRTGVDRLLEVANAASQRAAADLRRLLRVRGAEQSFDSAAL